VLNCFKCEREVNPLALFPGLLCVECYALTEEANAPLTGEGVASMWRNPKLIS
jgi:hypothetical protein